MPGRPKPKRQQAYDLARAKELVFAQALKIYAAEMESGRQPHERKGSRKIVEEVTAAHRRKTGQNIKFDPVTLQRRYNGRRSIAEFNAAKGHLNGEEHEAVLVELERQSARGFPLTHRMLREVINATIKNRNPNFKGVGKNFTQRFVQTHAARIGTYWSCSLDENRARAVNPHIIKAWFDLLEKIITEGGVPFENIWGADETGFGLGVAQTERVIGVAGQKHQYAQRSGGRENVTVMVTIGTRGTSIPPLVIFKGQHFLVKWLQDNPLNAVIGYSKKGWMTGEIGLEWIKHFDKHTVDQAGGAPRLLLVDGHVSHYTLELLNYAREHNIIVLCYPSHSTHVFQGLDVACFGRLKQLYSQYGGEQERTTGQKITKEVFLTPFSQAYVETFTPETIKSAFASTGVYPFNRNILTAKDIAPSLPTSTQSSLPLDLPEAVALLAGIWDPAPRARAESPDWDLGVGGFDPNAVVDDNERSDVEMAGVGGTAEGGGEDGGDGMAIDVDRPTSDGSNQHNPFHAALAQTPAGFLLGNVPITSRDSLQRLPFYHLGPAPAVASNFGEPETEREAELTRVIEEQRGRETKMVAAYRGTQAQLVLADRHCSLLQGQLHAKESTAAARREGRGKGRLMGDNLPKVLTQGEFYERSVQNREIEIAEQEAKRQREARNAAKKQMMDEWNERERVRKAADKEARRLWEIGPLAQWEAESAARKAEGRKARWTKPKPPKRTKPIPKPQLPQEPVQVAGPAIGDEPEGEGEDEFGGGEDGGEGDTSESEGENEGEGDDIDDE